MPTIVRSSGLSVRILYNDHQPSHVHVYASGATVIFRLNCPDGPPEIHENYGFSLAAAKRASTLIEANLAELCAKWRAIHGD